MALQPLKADATVVTEPKELVVQNYTKKEITEFANKDAFDEVIIDVYGKDILIDDNTGYTYLKSPQKDILLAVAQKFDGRRVFGYLELPNAVYTDLEPGKHPLNSFIGLTNIIICCSVFGVFLNMESVPAVFGLQFQVNPEGLLLMPLGFGDDAQTVIAKLLTDETAYMRMALRIEKIEE